MQGKDYDDSQVVKICGSPLRVQGKAEYVAEIVQDIRITPACAGKSS